MSFSMVDSPSMQDAWLEEKHLEAKWEALEVDMEFYNHVCTTLVYGQNGSMAVLAISEKGGLLAAPDVYMKKLAAPAVAKNHVDLNKSATENLKIISDCMERAVQELVVVVMDRPRHKELINEIRQAGARVRLISDGDVSAAISCARKCFLTVIG